MTTGTAPVTIEAGKRALVERDFVEFLGYVKIQEPGTGVIPFEMWPHLVELANLLQEERWDPDKDLSVLVNALVSILKARQIGLSWLLAAYALWRALYSKAAVVLDFSQGEDEAKVLLAKSRTIHNLLPPFLQSRVGTDSTTEMTFPDVRSKIVAYPSTEKAGRGEKASLAIQDEADFHEALDDNYLSVLPAVESGGQLIQVSTVNKKKAVTLFKENFRKGRAGLGGWVSRFYGWRSRPGRDDEWYRKTREAAPTTADMSPELLMEQEYPGTEQEALAPSRVLAAFDKDALAAMMDDTREPIETKGLVNIYQKFAVAKRYGAGTDTSHGAGLDQAVTVVLDLRTGYVVADVQSASLSPQQIAHESVKMLAQYDNPVWAIEDNDWGKLTVNTAKELRYPRLYEMVKDKAGWHANPATRPLLWGELIEAVDSRLITIPNKLGLAQFSSVIRNPDKNGRIEAMTGTHDDYPMAVGLAWQMRHQVGTGITKVYDPRELTPDRRAERRRKARRG